jgi:membrane-associated phospholipid phosphatase
MKPHYEGEHDNPKFDKKVVRSLILLAVLAVLGYLINKGLGNFVVFAAFLYLLNHFVLLRLIDAFQNKLWPRFQACYARWLERAVHWPLAVLGGTLMLFVLTFVVMKILKPKVELFPAVPIRPIPTK